MRIYMQTRPSPDHPPRFYHLFLQEDLLEGWTLVRENGQQGSPGKVTRQHYTSWEEAQEAMLALRDKQIERGYQVVFLQGHTPPTR
jgi:predicted DNA-binding WGR domain protein